MRGWRLLVWLTALSTFASLPLARAEPPRSAAIEPLGDWLTEDHQGVIRIVSCGQTICGRIVGMSKPDGADGGPSRGSDGRPECGLTILANTVATERGRWDGKITDPEDGSVWHCLVWIDGQDQLHLRGYVLFPLLGVTQTWTRYTGPLAANCAMTG